MQSEEPKTQQLFANNVALACIDKYLELPKTGKPISSEWTVLSGIVQYNNNTNLQVVSIGTGSKCIGANKMSPKGDILNDSHAEVMARRGFLLYLYNHIDHCCNEKPSIFEYENGKFHLKESIQFAFYSSQLPCGDATIHPKTDFDLIGDTINLSHKRNKQDDYKIYKITKINNADDVHRTGAKCVKDAIQDTHEPGLSYHIVGQVRTKPGRGDPTLSVSCSDKMARWIHIGIQGALLDMLLDKPVYMSDFIFGAAVPYCDKSLKRALLGRNKCECPYLPKITRSSISFSNSKSDSSLKPAAASIVWVNTATPIFEVAVLGKKLGVTKKARNSLSSQLSISKYSLYKRFITICNSTSMRSSILGNKEFITPYNEMKELSTRYKTQWNKVKEEFFKTWTNKPNFWNFTLDSIKEEI